MASGGVVPLALAVVLALATPGLLEASVPVVAGPVLDGVWAEGFRDALAWSTEHRDELVAPLVAGAGMQGWHHDAITAHQEGKAWAEHHLAIGTRETLDDALTRLLAPHDTMPTRFDAIPEPFVTPLATLAEAQLELAARTAQVHAAGLDAYAHVRATGLNAAWLAGVVQATLPDLHAATPAAPSEPVLVDPLGLIILGSNNDDTYDPPPLPVRPIGPILLIEPGGHDTYNVAVATNGLQADPPLPPDPLPGAGPAIAIELAGNDAYNEDVAGIAVGLGFLLDEAGNDSYSTKAHSFTTSFAANGASLLLDRAGDDHYHAKENGIAYAINRGIAVLADWEGDDVYEADTGLTGGFTHAAAENTASLAVLRDLGGADSYTANGLAAASAEDDSYVLLVDDEGDDDFHLDLVGGGSLGRRYHSEGGLEGPRNRGLAYFLDAGGTDSYTYGSLGTGGDASLFGEGVVRVVATSNQKHGVFVDCETPVDGVVPCQQHQSFVLNEIVSNP